MGETRRGFLRAAVTAVRRRSEEMEIMEEVVCAKNAAGARGVTGIA